MKTTAHTARRTAITLATAVLTLTAGASVAQAAGSATGPATAPRPAIAGHHHAPHKAINGHSRAHRPGRITHRQPRLVIGGPQVSFYSLNRCVGPFRHTWGYSATCIWGGMGIFNQKITTRYEYLYWNGRSWQSWYALEYDDSTGLLL
jgi:hypothetical protein